MNRLRLHFCTTRLGNRSFTRRRWASGHTRSHAHSLVLKVSQPQKHGIWPKVFMEDSPRDEGGAVTHG
jgi:hypothetical protein